MQKEPQADRYLLGRILLHLETFSHDELRWSVPNQEMPDLRFNRAQRVKTELKPKWWRNADDRAVVCLQML